MSGPILGALSTIGDRGVSRLNDGSAEGSGLD